MSYTPTNWKAGDTVTSAKLNKIEQGIVNAGGANILVTNCNLDSSNASGGTRSAGSASGSSAPRLDKTLGEILNADFVIVKAVENNELMYGFIGDIQYIERQQIYMIAVLVGMGMPLRFIAQDESDYPTIAPDNSGDDSGDDSGNTPVVE